MQLLKLAELIQDKKGKLSTSRLGFIVWCLGTFLMFMYLSYVNNTFPEIPESVQWILAILVGNRACNKFLEGKEPGAKLNINSNTSTTPPAP